MSDYAMPMGSAGRKLLQEQATRWWVFMLLGVASVVVGVILLLNPFEAVATLALLVAFGLMFTGIGELVGYGRYRGAWSVAAGVVLIVAAVVAVLWPGITLWALAVVTALGLLLSGSVRMAAAIGDQPSGWGWLLAGGILSTVVGVLALAWPGATVLVLAILLGIRMVLFGLVEIANALTLRELRGI